MRGNREAGIRETREAVPGESDLNSANVSPPPKNLYALLLWEIAESSASVPCDGEKKVSVLYGQQSCMGREKSLLVRVWATVCQDLGNAQHLPSLFRKQCHAFSSPHWYRVFSIKVVFSVGSWLF